MDNFIQIDTSPVMHDDNWIGVVCCAIFYAGNEREMISRRIHFRSKALPVDLRADVVIDQSDHMWLFYVSRQEMDGRKINLWRPSNNGVITLKCSKLIIRGNEFGKTKQEFVEVDVKKYGYRWVYEQDLQPSNLTMMDGENLTARKRKFSIIEGNR